MTILVDYIDNIKVRLNDNQQANIAVRLKFIMCKQVRWNMIEYTNYLLQANSHTQCVGNWFKENCYKQSRKFPCTGDGEEHFIANHYLFQDWDDKDDDEDEADISIDFESTPVKSSSRGSGKKRGRRGGSSGSGGRKRRTKQYVSDDDDM